MADQHFSRNTIIHKYLWRYTLIGPGQFISDYLGPIHRFRPPVACLTIIPSPLRKFFLATPTICRKIKRNLPPAEMVTHSEGKTQSTGTPKPHRLTERHMPLSRYATKLHWARIGSTTYASSSPSNSVCTAHNSSSLAGTKAGVPNLFHCALLLLFGRRRLCSR